MNLFQFFITRIIKRKKVLLLIHAMLAVFYISAQPTFESFATSKTGGIGNYNLSAKPPGVKIGELLISVTCYESGSSQSITSPPGWILIEKTDNGSNIGIATFYKVADSLDVIASTFTFSLSEDKKWTLSISRISGVDASVPIDVFSENSGSDGNVIATSVTTTVDSCLVLSVYGNKKDATYEGSNNEEYEIEHPIGQIASQMLETFVKLNAGSTGNTTAIPSNSESWIAQQIAIRKSNTILIDNYRSIVSGDYYNSITWERERSDGTWLNPSDISPPIHANVVVRNTHNVTASDSLVVLNSQVRIESGGVLNIQN